MTEPEGLPVWRPGTHVRYWPDRREGAGEIGQTQGSPFITADGTPAVYIAGHESWLPLARVEVLSKVSIDDLTGPPIWETNPEGVWPDP